MFSSSNPLPAWLQAQHLPKDDLQTLAHLHCEAGCLYRQKKLLCPLAQIHSFYIEQRQGAYLSLQAAFKKLLYDALWIVLVLAALWLFTELLPAPLLEYVHTAATFVAMAWVLMVVSILGYLMLRRRQHAPVKAKPAEHFLLYAKLNGAHAPVLICATQERQSLLILQQYLQDHATQLTGRL